MMIHKDLIYDCVGCMLNVYKQLNNVWSENIYEQALIMALQEKGIKVAAQQNHEVLYKKGKIGLYRLDLLVEDKVIIELKAIEELQNLHKAQLISYLKGFQKPIGILANFAGKQFERQIIPNKYRQIGVLQHVLDFEQVKIPSKDELKYIFDVAVEVLKILGPGFYEEIYRRAFFKELNFRKIPFETKNKVEAFYNERCLGEKWVNFLKLQGDTLVSTIAVKEISPVLKSRFATYLKLMGCKRGLIFNFSKLRLKYSYIQL